MVHGKSLPELDSLVSYYRVRYFNRCMKWALNDSIPESSCEYELLEGTERRFGSRFNEKQLLRTADDILFRRIDRELLLMLKKNPVLKHQAHRNFKNKGALLLFYRKHFGFSNFTSKQINDFSHSGS